MKTYQRLNKVAVPDRSSRRLVGGGGFGIFEKFVGRKILPQRPQRKSLKGLEDAESRR
jgi:hypothetical protein